MLRMEAMTILGLTFNDSFDEAKIKQAWKQKVRHAHPDKNHLRQESATRAAQLLNEAKEVLLERLAQDLENKLWEADMARRMVDLQAQKVALDKQMAEMGDLDKYCADMICKGEEAASKKKEECMRQAHQERTVYEQTFYQRMRDYKARTKKLSCQEQS